MTPTPPRRPRRWSSGVLRVPFAVGAVFALAALTAWPEQVVLTRTDTELVGEAPTALLYQMGRADAEAQLVAAVTRLGPVAFT